MLGTKKTGGISDATTLISKETRVRGDIEFSGNLDVEGVVDGNITAKSGAEAFLRVVESGRVHGDIIASALVINGSVEGNVFATTSLELAPKARVKGSVMYRLIQMAPGAEVNGSLTHVDENTEMPGVTADQGKESKEGDAVATLKPVGGSVGQIS